VSVPR